jgi:hypothetical protein
MVFVTVKHGNNNLEERRPLKEFFIGVNSNPLLCIQSIYFASLAFHCHSLNLEDEEIPHLMFSLGSYHVLLHGCAINELPHLLWIWRDPKANNTMYHKDLFKN